MMIWMEVGFTFMGMEVRVHPDQNWIASLFGISLAFSLAFSVDQDNNIQSLYMLNYIYSTIL